MKIGISENNRNLVSFRELEGIVNKLVEDKEKMSLVGPSEANILVTVGSGTPWPIRHLDLK
jgi:hypothetical protein